MPLNAIIIIIIITKPLTFHHSASGLAMTSIKWSLSKYSAGRSREGGGGTPLYACVALPLNGTETQGTELADCLCTLYNMRNK